MSAPLDDSETASVARNYVRVEDLDEGLSDYYWTQIDKTLRKVFFSGQDSSELSGALERLGRLRNRVKESKDPAFPAAVYHLDPFQVAIDLAGGHPATAEQKEQYLAELQEFAGGEGPSAYDPQLLGEVKPSDTARAIPDDPAAG